MPPAWRQQLCCLCARAHHDSEPQLALGHRQQALTTTTTTITTTRTLRLQLRCRPGRAQDDCTRVGPLPTLAADGRWDPATTNPLLPRQFPACHRSPPTPPPLLSSPLPPQPRFECPSCPTRPGLWNLRWTSLSPFPPLADAFNDYDYELARPATYPSRRRPAAPAPSS
jgi:hypothetical protein